MTGFEMLNLGYIQLINFVIYIFFVTFYLKYLTILL